MVQNVARTLHLSPTSVYLLSVSVSLVLAIVLGCGLVQKESRTPASCGAGGVLCANPFALLAAFIILENLGIHLTVIWTTLGVGSVAVALALQETLSNFFSGLYLLADPPINPGDYTKLDSGHEGYVVHVGWRSTSIRTLGSKVVVAPNAVLARAAITN